MIGTKLAHYEIYPARGIRGMGDAYLATDSKLGRNVAIKFLPEAFNHDHDSPGANIILLMNFILGIGEPFKR